jgi:CheY-like chemotaxis protein
MTRERDYGRSVRRVMARPLHVLITDDEVDKRLLLVRAVSRQFPTASIFECHNGQEALDYFISNRVVVVVTDHNMFPINGVELIQNIRRMGSAVPIIMVSHHPDMKEKAEAAGADLFLGDQNLLTVGRSIAAFLNARGISEEP